MAAVAYYLFVLPLSYLPLRIIYFLADFLYFILRFVFPYRKAVIQQNLQIAFPTKTQQEIDLLTNKFYRHFSDLLAEGIKNLSISERELKKRFKVLNPEILEDLFKKQKNVLLVSGHYNNWEWLITAQNLLFSHQAVGIGMPMTSKFWDKKINSRRSRFGMQIVHSKNVRQFMHEKHLKPIATLVLGDQSPGDTLKSYWMPFLNKMTAVQFGCEMLAHTHQQAVVFFITRKVKRGYYEMDLRLITANPSEMKWGEITEAHTKLLEKEILKTPESWIWSHKRWKREEPKDFEVLREEQKLKFYERF